jgi:hypothetical protein
MTAEQQVYFFRNVLHAHHGGCCCFKLLVALGGCSHVEQDLLL